MKKIILSLMAIAITQFAFAQIEQKPADEYKERPYPATNTPASEDAATFLTLFEDSEVGNLKVYSHPGEKIPANHYFKGTEISDYFHSFFSGEYRELLSDGAKAFATHSIKGNRGEHFIIRMATNKGANTLVLFDLNGERLEPIQTLAYAFCQKGYCYQQDSFITDLDGDTDLDLLIKYKRVPESKPESKGATSSTIMIQSDEGLYQVVDPSNFETEVDKGMYNMKKM